MANSNTWTLNVETGEAVKNVNNLNDALNDVGKTEEEVWREEAERYKVKAAQEARKKKWLEEQGYLIKKVSEAAKEGSNYWTELNAKISVIGGILGKAWEYAQKFHELQMKGRKENMQLESMMNSTRAKEIEANLKEIDKGFGDTMDKAAKLRMAYASGFSDIKYDVKDFSTIVQNMAQRTGKDIGEVAEELQQMFLKGDNGILEDMGLLHNSELEMQKYAGSIGKAVDELTDFEIRQGKANINMKYLNAEFNNTKPLQDTYINLTNKATHATDGFSGTVADLTDEIFGLNAGMGNLSIRSQIENTRKQIEEAEKLLKTKKTIASGGGSFGSDDFYGAGLETIADEKDIKETEERLRKANSKLLSLQSEAGKILTGRMIGEYGIRKAESKKELKAIMTTIKGDIDTANEQLKGFMANGKFIMNDEALKLMSQVDALKNVYGVAQKELNELGNIKNKAVGKGKGKDETTKSEGILKAMGITGELSKEQEASIMSAMSTLSKIQGLSNDEANTQFEKDIQRIKDEGNERLALALEQLDKENKLFEIKQKEKIVLQKKAKEEEERIDKMTYAVLQSAANAFYNGILSDSDDLLQQIAAVALQTAGSKIFADGLTRLWEGGGNMLKFSEPAKQAEGAEQFAYGLAEVGAGLGLGYAGKELMPSKEGTSKSTAADDRNKFEAQKDSQMSVYLYPDEKHYLRSFNKSLAKVGGQK